MADNGGWPDMSELQSDEARILRQAVNSLGHQQMEILGSIDGLKTKADEQRDEHREHFRGIRQQITSISKAFEAVGDRISAVDAIAADTREIVNGMRKVLHELRIAPPGTVLAPSAEAGPVSFDDFDKTPHGGIHLNERDQAILMQRLAKLEEERKIADALAADRAATIAAQKAEAERLIEEKRQEVEKKRLADTAQADIDLKKSQERRAWLAAYIVAATTAGGGIVWLVQMLTHR